MKRSCYATLLVLGVSLILTTLLLSGVAFASVGGREASLNAAGAAYEVNAGDDEMLWISDYGAGEIWQVDPVNEQYTVFEGLTAVTDARSDGAGYVWWVNADESMFGRLAPAGPNAMAWFLPGAVSLLGTALDEQGNVWLSDAFESYVYRFNPTTTVVCTYTVPVNGASNYLIAHAASIWLADWKAEGLLELDPATNTFTRWQLPGDSFAQGLAVDEQTRVWYTDQGRSVLARLDPETDQLVEFSLPAGTEPVMVASGGEYVWYTEAGTGTVGVLRPADANGTTSTRTRTSSAAMPTCDALGDGEPVSVTKRTGLLDWTPSDYLSAVDDAGWTVYQLPEGGVPWGLALKDREVWVVDQGRQMLVQLPDIAVRHQYLPLLIK